MAAAAAGLHEELDAGFHQAVCFMLLQLRLTCVACAISAAVAWRLFRQILRAPLSGA